MRDADPGPDRCADMFGVICPNGPHRPERDDAGGTFEQPGSRKAAVCKDDGLVTFEIGGNLGLAKLPKVFR